MSLDGKAFTYVNQLASSGNDLSQRFEWFEVSCCPPNVTRTLGCLGGYIWSSTVHERRATINVHLYTSAVLRLEVTNSTLEIRQTTDWPWDGNVTFDITINGPPVEVNLRLRVPGWASSCEVSIDNLLVHGIIGTQADISCSLLPGRITLTSGVGICF